MEILLWFGTLILAGFFLGLTVFNWRHFLTKTTKGDDRLSPVPLAGGLLGIAAAYVCPVDAVWNYWWIPLIVDFGCLPYPIWMAYAAAVNKA